MNYPISRSELQTIGPAVNAARISDYVDKCTAYMQNIILFKAFYDASGGLIKLDGIPNNAQKPMLSRMIMQQYASPADTPKVPLPLGDYAVDTGKYKIQFRLPMANIFNTPAPTPAVYNPLDKITVFPWEMVDASPAIVAKLLVLFPDTTFVLAEDKMKLDIDWSPVAPA